MTEGGARGTSAAAQARVQRYRATHRRLDYVPSPEALAVIERYVSVNPAVSMSAILDYLVRTGHAALSGGGVSGNGDAG